MEGGVVVQVDDGMAGEAAEEVGVLGEPPVMVVSDN